MQQLPDKFRKLVLPLLYLTLLLLFVYTFIHYKVVMTGSLLFAARGEWLDLVVPLALSAILVLMVMRPRIKLLELNTRKGSAEFMYIFLAILVMAAPVMIAQSYMVSDTGKLTEMEDVRDITRLPPTLYYTMKHYFIDKDQVGIYKGTRISGKYNSNLDLLMYLAVPVFPEEGDTNQSNTIGWIGIHYIKTISNHQSGQVKMEEKNAFFEKSWGDFLDSDLQHFAYLRRIVPNMTSDRYLYAEQNSDKQYYAGPPFILEEIYQPFSERNGNKPLWLLVSLILGFGVWTLAVGPRSFRKDPETLLYPELADY